MGLIGEINLPMFYLFRRSEQEILALKARVHSLEMRLGNSPSGTTSSSANNSTELTNECESVQNAATGLEGSTSEKITHEIYWVEESEKREQLLDLLYSVEPIDAENRTLIFAETKRGVDELADFLQSYGFMVASVHRDTDQNDHCQALLKFLSGQIPMLVATAASVVNSIFGTPDVKHVINFDLPPVIEEYVNRHGFTGRSDRHVRKTISFFNEKNRRLVGDLMELMLEANQEIPSWLESFYDEQSSTYGSRNRRRRGGKSQASGWWEH